MKNGVDLTDCSRCRVYTPKGERLSEARVVCSDQGEVSIYFPSYSHADKRLRTRIDFFTQTQGVVITLCEVLMRRNPAFPAMPEAWMADVKILDVKQVIQRQQDIRCKVDINILFELAPGKGGFFGTIKNISAGGFYMTCPRPLEKGECIFFSYTFRTLERRFEAEVIRRERLKGGGYGCGCRFIELTDGAESAIRGYVYKKQQEHKTKKK